MASQQRHLLVEGRVQGVSFRACTEQKGSELGLQGYVRNLPDGRVEIVAEGPRDALDKLEQWCWQGSPAATVTSVSSESQPASGNFSGFVTR
jgi:acylphosphatase